NPLPVRDFPCGFQQHLSARIPRINPDRHRPRDVWKVIRVYTRNDFDYVVIVQIGILISMLNSFADGWILTSGADCHESIRQDGWLRNHERCQPDREA